MAEFSSIVQKNGDSRIFLWADGKWFYYDQMQKPIGSGAMGTVYVGYSVDSGTKVAIKRVNDRYADEMSIRNRARLEASLSFRHPNMIEMIGLCEYPNKRGPIFMLSNYVSGQNIDKYIKNYYGYVENKEEFIALKICKVLDALEYLHYKGVVHRDIKPSNIMIDNNTGEPKLMDLGVAKLFNSKTLATGLVGTPQYASPEQIDRTDDDEALTPAADIYALGVTFYELLTGVNPFDSEIESEVLSNNLKKKLPKNKLISRKMMSVLRKATEKDKKKRYQTAKDFKCAINDALNSNRSMIDRIFDNDIYIAIVFLSFVVLVIVLIFK